MCGNGGRACELRVGMHSAHRIGHTVRGRAGRHIVGVQGSARAAAGRNREVLNAVFHAPLFIGSCNRVLEAEKVFLTQPEYEEIIAKIKANL